MESSIIIGGSGGQGILFLGKILAYSAMLETKEVTWFPSYGAEVRGGTANCTVIISDELIGSPIVRNPEMLIVMNDASLQKFQPNLKQNGLLIFDSSLIEEPSLRKDIKVIAVPATEISRKIGNTKAANMVLLGAFTSKTEILEKTSVLEAIESLSPAGKRKIVEINKNAFIEGMRYIEDTKGKNI
ncbi:MAG: 2-oxoacid:acceptor oxidoreductase family protein [Nitrospirota bacterium]